MEILTGLLKNHPTMLGLIMLTWTAVSWLASWLSNNKATKIISAIPMPTKNSSAREIWWFQFTNNLVGNEKRAAMPPLEASPNFKDAVQPYVEKVCGIAPPSA